MITTHVWLRGLTLVCAMGAIQALAADSDGDGVDDSLDNCSQVQNADQRDSNGDGFGNVCDADLNNDLIVNAADLGLLRAAFFSADPDADANGDGTVNVVDLGSMRVQFFGPPGPGAVLDGFGQRPFRVDLDFDNNGVADAQSMILYTQDGSLRQQTYTVTGDGTPDLFQFAPDVGFVSDMTYYPDGSLQSVAQDNFTDGNDFLFEYEYNPDGTLDRSDDTVLSPGGAILFQQYVLYNYVDGLRVRDDVFQLGTDTLLLERHTLYDANDLPDSASWINQLGPVGGVEFDFDWNPDGTLMRKRTDLNADGTFDEIVDFIHAGGSISQRVTVGSLSAIPPNFTATVVYDAATGRIDRIEYDANSDGSVDAVGHYFWEDGPCKPFFLPDEIPLGGFDGDPDSPVGDILTCGP